MHILGIETSTPTCSVAISDSEQITAQYSQNVGPRHSGRLLELARRLLEDTGLKPEDLDGVAVSAGPGSFTGLRIGMGAAKGLCLGASLPLLTVSTLEGLAFRAPDVGLPICSTLDAYRGEVYVGLYRRREDKLDCLTEDFACPLEDLIDVLPLPALFVGPGAVRYRGEIKRALSPEARFLCGPFNGPEAGPIALLGAVRLRDGAVTDLCDAEPNYLRRSRTTQVWEARSE